MVSLREMEIHQGLNKYFHGAIADCVKDIIGVQFRNQATIGGSVFGRFGFSDVLTCLLALDTSVELYKGGLVPLAEFIKMKRDNDILVRIRIRKDGRSICYLAERNCKNRFSGNCSSCGGKGKSSLCFDWCKTDESSAISDRTC